jgi:D-alanine-D-alanine ligase
VPIGITKDGRWLTAEHAENLLTGKLVLEPRNLRAGDPETTSPAAVLARAKPWSCRPNRCTGRAAWCRFKPMPGSCAAPAIAPSTST